MSALALLRKWLVTLRCRCGGGSYWLHADIVEEGRLCLVGAVLSEGSGIGIGDIDGS